MQIYKDRQFLVFDFEDGKTVKYDFATKKAIGKSGKVVNNLCSQLKGLTIDELCSYCTDIAYGNFLRFVKTNCSNRDVSNIGTVLSKVPEYARFEQIFSAGIQDLVDCEFKYTINDIPKPLIKLCREHKIKLSNFLLQFYKENSDAFLLAYKLDYMSLTEKDIYTILSAVKHEKEYYGAYQWQYVWAYKSPFNKLILKHKYNAKALLLYIDHLKTFEAMDDITHLLRELVDYADMMSELSPKFEKYPKHFLTTHQIASRNYNRLKAKFEEDKFKCRIDKSLERTFGVYRFYYPDSTQAIKDEATQQSNCVASYIDKVIDGQCHILFLRYKDRPDESLVTIEVRGGQICQALQKYNHPLTKEQKEVVEMWNKWQANKLKNNTKESESEE